MRFRAEISSLATFTRVCQSIDKLSKRCVLKLARERIHFICAGEDTSGVQVWAQFEADTLFKTSRVESNSGNEIYLELLTDSLQKALKSADGATEVILRLTKKGKFPVLSVSIRNASGSGRQLDVVQDVSVKVLPNLNNIKEPMCPDPDLHIVLPPLTALTTVLARLSKISTTVTLSANRSGVLRMGVESDQAKVTVEWRDLRHPEFLSSDDPAQRPTPTPQRGDAEEFFTCSLDVKSLSKFLTSRAIAGTAIASICRDFCCVFYVYIGAGPESGGVLTYFCPGVLRDGED